MACGLRNQAGRHVKILDFGLAKRNRDRESVSAENSPSFTMGATQAGTILGAAAYMAPEQARVKVVDKRADIWAFGVVVYESRHGLRLLAQVLTRQPELDRTPVLSLASARSAWRGDGSPDGQRFLINTALEESTATPLTVVLNWQSGLK
jgi:serine/threonine protein kinase